MSSPKTISGTGDTCSLAESSTNTLVVTGPEPQATATARTKPGRRLLTRDEVISMLQLTGEQVQGLINTRQLLAFRIAGEERFDSRDFDGLIEIYKATAARRTQ